MMGDESDPVLMLVAALRASRPSMAREERVRQRCHAVMERRRLPAPSLLRRAADLALIGVAGGYAAIALVQATEVAAHVLGLH